jgi:hypothetical protein
MIFVKFNNKMIRADRVDVVMYDDIYDAIELKIGASTVATITAQSISAADVAGKMQTVCDILTTAILEWEAQAGAAKSAGHGGGCDTRQPQEVIPEEFNRWWDADKLTQTNPFDDDSPAYWALEGWCAHEAAVKARITNMCERTIAGNIAAEIKFNNWWASATQLNR